MNKIITDNITDSAKLPFLKAVIDFWQDNNSEALKAAMIGLIGKNYDPASLTKIYRIWGVEITNVGYVWSWTAGQLFFFGEVYSIDAGTLTTSDALTLVTQISNTSITYTDSANYDTLSTRKLTFGSTSGSAILPIDIFHNTVDAGAISTAVTLKFSSPQTRYYMGNSGITTVITLDTTLAKPGNKVTMVVASDNNVMSIATVSGQSVIIQSGTGNFNTVATQTVEVEYMGYSTAFSKHLFGVKYSR